MQVSRITSSADFVSLGQEWNDLLAASELSNIFLTHEWLLSWWEVYGEGGELFVLTCRDELCGSLIGAFPLYRVREGFLPHVRILRFIAGRNTGSDFLEPVSLPQERDQILGSFFEYIASNEAEWDVIDLEGVDAESLFVSCVAAAGMATSMSSKESNQISPFIVLPRTWDAFLGGLSKKFRQKIGYYRRALERTGAYEIRRVREPGELQDALRQLMQIRKDRLEAMGIDFDKVRSIYQRFHTVVMDKFLQNGWLQMYFLDVDGVPVAYAYQFAYQKRIFFYQTGFDRKWGAQSVGFVLLGHVIHNAICEGYELFEFLRGDEKYKYDWNISGSRKLVAIKIYANNYCSTVYKIKYNFIRFCFNLKRNIVNFLQIIKLNYFNKV